MAVTPTSAIMFASHPSRPGCSYTGDRPAGAALSVDHTFDSCVVPPGAVRGVLWLAVGLSSDPSPLPSERVSGFLSNPMSWVHATCSPALLSHGDLCALHCPKFRGRPGTCHLSPGSHQPSCCFIRSLGTSLPFLFSVCFMAGTQDCFYFLCSHQTRDESLGLSDLDKGRSSELPWEVR